ncbi:sulfatase-like hydrolase/transferase [Geothrix campi]|uniref:sulfatase-like hydrolase/transferase n=1 Tax=Geothrix campi TaxID=2966450 RepID=UPI002147D536|nr:sulfatase-like hydrolase/transferase [Geothrix sp. SG10]
MQSQKHGFFAWKMIILLGITLLLFFWMNPSFFSRFLTLKSFIGRGVFLLTFLMAWGALLACAIARRIWAALFLLFFAVNLFISVTYARVMGRAMTLNDAQNLREAMGSTPDAVHQYWSTVWVVALAIMAMVALILLVRTQIRKRNNLPLMACSLGITLSYGAFLARGGAGAMLFFPANFESSLHALALSAEPLIRHRTPRDEQPIPIIKEPINPSVKHVVLIIDESIEANVFQEAMKGIRIENAKNLGIGYSFGNNSPSSNLMLRRLADPSLPDQSIRQFPSVFELAKQQGFTTTYLDAQGVLSDRDVQDYFDAKDTKFIDNIPPLKEYGPRHQRDINAMRILLDVLPKQEKSFILVNKQGIHFPYLQNLPPEMASVPDPYRTSVERTSINFLVGIAPHLPPGTLVFYTSDHGQNFHGRAPHNNMAGECSVSEWQVPIVILYSPDMKAWAERISPQWQNCAAHSTIAESVRNLFGERNPSASSFLTQPTFEDVAMDRVCLGSPKGLFGEPILSLWINKQSQTFMIPPKK